MHAAAANDDLHRRVYARQVALLYRNAPLVYTFTLLNGLILTFVQRHHVPGTILLGWLGALLLVLGARLLLVLRYTRRAPAAAEAPLWGRAYLVRTALAGGVWGAAALLLFPAASIAHQVFVAFALVAISAGAVAVLAVRLEALLLFMLPALLPLAVQFFLQGSELQIVIGLMIVLFTIGMLIAAWNLHRSMGDALQLHFAQQALRESEEKYRLLFSHEQDAILFFDAATIRILDANEAAVHLYGYSRDELLGLSTTDLSAEPEATAVSIRMVAKHNGPARIPLRWHRKKSGEIFPVEISAGVFLWQGRQVICSIVRDISERWQAEQQGLWHQAELARMARLSIAGEMASGLAHEINQPLTAIVILADACTALTEAGPTDREQLRRALAQIAEQGRRAGDVIRRIREFTRKTEPHRTRADVNALVQDAVRFAEAEARYQQVELRLELTGDLPPVYVDAIELQQVMLNLVRNGIEAMEETAIEDRVVTVRTRRLEDDRLEVAVQDAGSGLSQEVAERLFHPFFTTKPGGMGLGLSISRSIVESYNGRLWATPNPDRGTTFRFTLPIRATEAEPEPQDIPA